VQIEFRVNPIGEIRKMRETMYADRYSWIEEVIQNAMRARASTLNFELEPHQDWIRVKDDGIGCKDPQLIFEKSTTGWDEEILKESNPFGEGFFTLVMVGDVITIRSYDWKVTFKPGNIINNRTMEGNLTVETGLKKVEGFEILITELQDDYNALFKLEPRIESVAPFVHSLDIYMNGMYIPKRQFTTTDNSDYATVINTEEFTGWIRPYRWGSNYDGYDEYIKIYFENRPVTDLRLIPGVSGVLHINKPIVDLRSPDRREFITNAKFGDFKGRVWEEVRKVMLNVVINGGDEDLKFYDETISYYLDVDEYKPHLKFLIQYGDYELLYQMLEKLQEGGSLTIDEIVHTINQDEVLDCVETDQIGAGRIEGSPTAIPQGQSESRSKDKYGSDYFKLDEFATFYFVKMDELPLYQDKIRLAAYYKIPVVVVKNTLEKTVISEDKRAFHIDYLREKVRIVANLKQIGYKDAAEIRALWLFNVISKAVGLDSNIFRICDLEAFLEKSIANSSKELTEVDSPAVAKEGVIYINRDDLNKSLLKSKSDRITNSDLKFVLYHLDDISHELAHAIFNTEDNTEEHVRKQLLIQNKIVKLLSTGGYDNEG